MNATVNATVTIPGYRLVELLYCGSRTVVYRGIRLVDQQAVALKLLQQDYPTFLDLLQFRNQYTLAKNLDIPGIIRTYNLEPYRNSYALVMEDFGGVSLRDYVRNQSLSLTQVLEIALEVAEILHELHQNRVIHKDIKPANILIHPYTKQVKLIDFSIASLLPKETQEIKNPNRLEGTLAYLAPEQTGRMNRGIDYRSDFYALGVTLFELLAGQLPFQSNDAIELVHCHIAKQPPSLSQFNLPEALANIVAKLMAKNAEDRYQSGLGLKHDLEKCLSEWQETGQIAPFELAERDIPDRFIIPEKLYGRATEVQTLIKAFDRVANPPEALLNQGVELMLIAGFSGIGKTAVVNEVHKPITRQKGYFIKGKFDQFNRHIPFSAFVQAFRNLIGQLLSESDAQIQMWKNQILEAIGENGQVLIEVIPELEIIIGNQPPVPELSGAAAQNRFNLLWQKFIGVFTTKEHPLAIFLDDLQWADSASLQLLKLLMDDNSYLLILGAYRDNEVSPAHPLMIAVESLKKAGKTVNTIALAPLKFNDTNQLVAETLNCAIALAQPLTELIDRKTQGNPFFTTQFLKALHEDGQIAFNCDRGYWECDLAQVKALSLTDDVVEFMAQQLDKLPAQTQEILQLAACVGNSFDLETLAIVSERSPADAADVLWAALQEGLILPQSEVYKFYLSHDEPDINTNQSENVEYRFLHDRVQQAAYSLIPENQKQATHLQIGQLLLKNTTATERDEKIFEIVNQLNAGIELISQQAERDELAQLNLVAASKAKASTAYAAAVTYLIVGIELLGADSWNRQYDLVLNFHLAAAEAQYLNYNFEPSQILAEIALQYAKTLLEKVRVYEVKIQIYIAQNQLQAAIDTALHVLDLLEVSWEKEAPKELKIEELIDLPKMTDPHQMAVLRILNAIANAAYISNPSLYQQAVFTGINLCINYGNSPLGIYLYSFYSLMLYESGDIDTSYLLAQLAVNLVEKFNSSQCKSLVLAVFNSSIRHWKEQVKETIEPLREAFYSGLETGELIFSGYAILHHCSHLFFQSENLNIVQEKLQHYIELLQKQKLAYHVVYGQVWQQSIYNLLGLAEEPFQLNGEAFNRAEILPILVEQQNGTTLFAVYAMQSLLCYLFQQPELAIAHAQQAEKYQPAALGHLVTAQQKFYYSLALLAAYARAEEQERDAYLQQVAANQIKMQMWAHHAPMNFLQKWHLVEAEKYRVLGNKVAAIEHYDLAITFAQQNEYVQEQALANELAAKFYLDWGKEKVAASYMQEAYYCYAKWGSYAKTLDLEKRYAQLLTPILQTEKQHFQPNQTITQISTEIIHTTTRGSASVLDLAAAIKASQTLSSEITLEHLLSTLMRVVMENAGADRGALILVNDQQWQVVVSCPNAQSCILESTPLDESASVPLSIINRVKHTQEVLVLDVAHEQSTFAADPYLIHQRPQSLLCSPLLNQGKLLGLVYLENNLATGAFGCDRIELLNLICSQAAISLENARLYQQLEDYSHTLEVKVAERTAQLQAAQKQMVAQEKLASLGTLTAGIAHELRNPLNFVNNYAELCVELTQELLQELENPTQDSNYIPELLTDLKQNAAAIHRHGQRADNIIRSMMEHAKSGTDLAQRQATDLNQLLTEAIQLIYHSQRAANPHVLIAFDTDYDDSIGKLEVMPNALSRALINLLDNACYAVRAKQKKADPNFTPKIEIATKNCGNCIEICLRDNGTGMTSEIQQKIFEPFFTTKPTGDGTGLGLSLTHDIIVDQHRGSLSVESELNSYTEFTITLPKVGL